MSDLSTALWTAWLLYWFSAAFLGTFTGVFTAWGVRAIYRKIRTPKSEWDKAVARQAKLEKKAKELNQ